MGTFVSSNRGLSIPRVYHKLTVSLGALRGTSHRVGFARGVRVCSFRASSSIVAMTIFSFLFLMVNAVFFF